jgi:hypothetical protein
MVTLSYTVPADIVALDAQDRPVLLVRLASTPIEEDYAAGEVIQALRKSLAPIPFAMIVGRRDIRVFAWDGEHLRERFSLPTSETLRFYSESYDPERSSASYIETLIGAWLRDAAYQWKSESPPGRKSMEAAQLWDRLAGGITISEALSRDPLY